MIRQVRFNETATNANNIVTDKRIFGFGTHPLATTNDYPAAGQGQMANATATGQRFRIIIDELLVGNALEEIACRAPIDNDVFDTVPLGTTPDDIAKCAVPDDVLPQSCPASMAHAVCICKLDGGCGTVAKGQPVGVADKNEDGAADNTSFMAGAVGIRCGSIDVPINLDESYWNPSGDQNRPAAGGFDVLGPAIVLRPQAILPAPLEPAPGVLPTNIECNLTFAPNVLDKQGNQVCAPVNGDEANDCTPGDVSAFKFKVVPMRVVLQSAMTNAMPANPILLAVTAPVDPASISAVTLTQNGNPVAGATITLTGTSLQTINITGPLTPNTAYEVHVDASLKDTIGQPQPMPYNFTIMTGA